jgi:hypothetical protein
MSILKYTVVILLAVMALGMMAYGLGIIPNDKPLTVFGTSCQPGINALALITPDPAMHDKCIQSCMNSFPDKNSYQYRACVRGC